MDQSDRIQLDRLIQANNVVDVTSEIRERKHSGLLRENIQRMLEIKRRYARLGPEVLENMMVSKCRFLFDNYTDIFNRIKKNELNLEIMWQFIQILSEIEEGKLDQHEGAFKVGKLLKELYIDSSLRRSDNLDKKYHRAKKSGNKNGANKIREVRARRKMTWAEYKMEQERKKKEEEMKEEEEMKDENDKGDDKDATEMEATEAN